METTRGSKRDWVTTARTLSEALPYLQRYDGKTVVIKFGGHAMGDDEAMASFARDVVLMKQCNVNPVIVHGGGPMINAMLDKLGVKSEYVDGLRVTDRQTVEVVEMVLAGSTNKRIVSALNAQGGRAVGLSGKDADLLVCDRHVRRRKNPETGAEEVIDIGLVGEPNTVNPGVLETFFKSDFIPVVAPIGIGRDGETYNINGDTAAGAIAGALRAERLLLLTDVAGVKGSDGEVIPELTPADCNRLMAEGVISGGMIPKVRTTLDAIARGVEGAVIIDGRAPHAVLLELFTAHGAGTLVRP
jgi:acetylglutamate kinase